MKVKLAQIINTSGAYSKLLEQYYLDVSIRRTLTKDMRIVTTEIDDFNKLSQDLLKKYQNSNERKESSYLIERQKLLDNEIELFTERFSENLVLNDERSTMSPKEIFNLDWLIYGDEKKDDSDNVDNK